MTQCFASKQCQQLELTLLITWLDFGKCVIWKILNATSWASYGWYHGPKLPNHGINIIIQLKCYQRGHVIAQSVNIYYDIHIILWTYNIPYLALTDSLSHACYDNFLLNWMLYGDQFMKCRYWNSSQLYPVFWSKCLTTKYWTSLVFPFILATCLMVLFFLFFRWVAYSW